MIRFIDLGKQIGCDAEGWNRQFAFFNTVSDLFITYNGAQVWDSRESFTEDWKYAGDWPDTRGYPLDRFLGLMPDWVPEK